MADIFKFKQFDVNQSGCAMKVNTDGVLLGALANAEGASTVLDIGTGTGVIALMLAQRFPNANIEAVEIDAAAAETADGNFKTSQFADRLQLYATAFEEYFEACPDKQFDFIVSNPPFFLNSLASPGEKKNLARHTDGAFFEKLIGSVARHLKPAGTCAMILPLETADMVKGLLVEDGMHLLGIVDIKSFEHTAPHREIITFGGQPTALQRTELIIYAEPKVYSQAYQHTLKEFLTIF
ncbi:tRNA1(Val) (adenine(37)-N6)-methyltransferase [Mucilaginibacter pedocola]|uniref:tRNA1(Val) (adenine(37)-N6)-methyltransferase n=1 Tax=Mucilaginibacter pedocola TaxID=1792845 RepID=A0A1S9PMV0_9SPHI|nr:methyltransferase [Mucilaginibacter pedocola]OOQ62270.1 hypothetical protein BC343_00915 [Mucilaginibacter pedocola]